MAQQDEEYVKGYHVYHSSWYAMANRPGRNTTDEIGFGEFAKGGGCLWEAGMYWYDLYDKDRPSPKFEAFHDGSWAGIHRTGILAALAELEDPWITPAQFRSLLDGLGFVDLTERRERGGAPTPGGHGHERRSLMAEQDPTPQDDSEYDRQVNEANEAWWESPQSDPTHVEMQDQRWARRRPR
jgi:hypothetical protein